MKDKPKEELKPDEGQIILYQAEDGTTKIEVRLENENVWLTQAQLVELYQSSKSNISEHIKHIFEEGELSEELVVRNFRTTTKHGAEFKKYQSITLSPVEKAYLENIKALEKKIGKKGNKK